MSTSIYFTLLVVHTYYYIFYILIGGGGSFYHTILFSFLFFHPACIFTHFAFLCIYWVCRQLSLFWWAGGKGKYYRLLEGKGWAGRRRSVLRLYLFLSVCLFFMSFCLYVCLCLSVLFSFGFVWFVGVLSLRIDWYSPVVVVLFFPKGWSTHQSSVCRCCLGYVVRLRYICLL